VNPSRTLGRSCLTLALLTALVTAAGPAPAATAKPAAAVHKPVAASPNTPFWAGKPTAAQFKAANLARIARAKALIAQMLAVKGPRTPENTLRPYDEASNLLDMAGNQAGLMEEVHPGAALRTTAEGVTQAVAAYATEVSLNHKVYEALKSIDATAGDDETRFYLTKEMRDFRLAGVDKDDATRKQIRALRDSIVLVGQEFDRNIREGSSTFKVKPEDLGGLPQDWLDSHKPGADGMVELSIEYPDYFPVMTYATREDTRSQMYMAAQTRAYPVNMAVLDTLIRMRDRLAHLVGFENYADYDCADRMAENGKNAEQFIAKVVAASEQRMKADYATLLARKQKDVPGATGLQWWDRFYLTNLVKKEQYDFDAQALRPYFPYANVKQGVLDVTSRMFGVTYKRIPNAPVWHPSVECYEMYEGGKLVGRFYLDMHPRKNKYNHAAQFDIRGGIEGRQIPEAALVCNLPGDKPGDPGLCDFDDVNTFFHEFGHLLHNLFAGHHQWLGVGGIRTESDFIEAPSQMLEEWMRDPKTLKVFAKHYQTGEPVPDELIQKMRRADEFGDTDPKGIGVRRHMVLAELSLSIYDRPPAEVNTDAMLEKLTNEYTPYPYVQGTHMQASFGHLNGYGAAYYTYMWSLVIAKDLFSKFNPDNLLDPVMAKRYRDAVLAPGGSKPAATLVKDFLGRDFGFDAYERWLNRSE
jgi:thimet oligopeptidase